MKQGKLKKKETEHVKARIPGNTVGLKEKELLRRQACEMLIRGEKGKDIALALGINQATIYRWKTKFIKKSEQGLTYNPEELVCRKPGPSKGRGLYLTHEQEILFFEAVKKHSPDELGFDASHWTQPLMIEFIEKNFSKTFSQRGMSWLCKRLGLTQQVPKRRDYRADPELIEEWKKRQIPKIQEWGKKVKAEVLFIDESTVKENASKLKSWGLRGKTPVAKESIRGEKINMICSLNTKGHLLYSSTRGRIDSKEFLKFLKKIRSHYGNKKKLYLILDNARIHKSKLVRSFVEETQGKVRIFFAPIQP